MNSKTGSSLNFTVFLIKNIACISRCGEARKRPATPTTIMPILGTLMMAASCNNNVGMGKVKSSLRGMI